MYSEPCQTSKMEFFCRNSYGISAVFVKIFILDDWHGSESASVSCGVTAAGLLFISIGVAASQLTFTCSKSTLETLEKSVKCFQI